MGDSNINDTLISFLETPLFSGDDIFEKFKTLPNAVYVKGEKPLERYLYVKGNAKNKVLLVAHTDTVWDKNYTKIKIPHQLNVENGIITNADGFAGIGADDRAGCAIMWLLKDSGHSLLLLDGEEHGHIGAMFLEKNKKLLKEINKHCYALQLDLWGNEECKYHGIKNQKSFCKFIESNGYKKTKIIPGGADVLYICKKMAGVNVSVGYKNYHQQDEEISFEDFNAVYDRVSNLLKNTKQKYRIPFLIRLYFSTRHIVATAVKSVLKPIKK